MTAQCATRRRRRALPGPDAVALLVLLLLAVCPLATSYLHLSKTDISLSPAASVTSAEQSSKSDAAEEYTPSDFNKEPQLVIRKTITQNTPKKKFALYQEGKDERTVPTFELLGSFVKKNKYQNPHTTTLNLGKKHSYFRNVKRTEIEQEIISEDDVNNENANTGLMDQDMVESEIVLRRTERSSRYTNSPATNKNSQNQESGSLGRSRNFLLDSEFNSPAAELGIISSLYNLELSETIDLVQDAISGKQYLSEEFIRANKGQRDELRETSLWRIGLVDTAAFGNEAYGSHYTSTVLQRDAGEARHIAKSNSRNSKDQESKNYATEDSFSNKLRQFTNKKRDLSPQYGTLGENNRDAPIQISGPVLSSENGDHSSSDVLKKMLTIRSEPQKQHGKQSVSLTQNVRGSVTSQGIIPFSRAFIHEDVSLSTLLPFIERPSDYNEAVFSVLPSAQQYNILGGLPKDSMFHQTVAEQGAVFDISGKDQLENGNIFHEDIAGVELFSPASPHIRLFKRSAAPRALTLEEEARLFQESEESESDHLSVALSKRSPLATGYVAGIDGGAEHHHNHVTEVTTGGLVHEGHHHSTCEFDHQSLPG